MEKLNFITYKTDHLDTSTMRTKPIASFMLNAVIFCMLGACNPPPRDEIIPEFKFAGKITAEPLKKSYKPGDTIWLNYSNPSKTLTDISTGQIIKSDSLALQFTVSFNPIHAPGVVAPFCKYSATGASDQGIVAAQFSTGFYGSFECNPPGQTSFRVGVIPANKGIYGLFLSESLQGVGSCPARSTRFPLSVISYKFDAADGNKDIYLGIPAGTLPEEVPKGTLARWIDEKRVLVIKVE